MSTVKHFVFTIIMAALFFAVAAAQDVRLAASYNRTDFPRPGAGGQEVTENINGFTIEGDVAVIRAGALRVSAAYNLKQMYDVEIYPDYFDGMKIVDLYRNVQTHSGLVQVGYTVKGAVEPFGAIGFGTRKIHIDADRQTIRTVRGGVNIPFSDESPIFVKAYVDHEKPYGALPMGFINPATWTLGVGVGFRFGYRHEYKTVPPETTPTKPVAR